MPLSKELLMATPTTNQTIKSLFCERNVCQPHKSFQYNRINITFNNISLYTPRINPVFMSIFVSLQKIDIHKRECYYIRLNEDIHFFFLPSPLIMFLSLFILLSVCKTRPLGKYVYKFYKILRKIDVLLKHRNVIYTS